MLSDLAQDQPQLNLNEKVDPKMESIDDEIRSLKKLKISGYIQTQFQYGESKASLKVGSFNENDEASFSRMGIRRGRLKFVFEEGIASGTYQLDFNENGLSVKDLFLHIKDPWIGTNSLQVGVFDRPFGHEIRYSSSRRESPERSIVFQTLFPDERDLGGMLTLQAREDSPWHLLKLEAGLFAGNGIKKETDSKKDFIGRLSGSKELGVRSKLGLGASYYNGSVYQGTENMYTIHSNGFVLNNDHSNKGKFAKREYIGFEGQYSISSGIGKSQLRTEYLYGIQPGNASNSKSPNDSNLLEVDTYIRNFSGGYITFVQDFGMSPFSAVLKYDWYDPNTKISKNEIGNNGTGKGDIAYKTFGMGLLWRASNSILLQAYYDVISNEKSDNLDTYDEDLKDNVMTLRLQFKF